MGSRLQGQREISRPDHTEGMLRSRPSPGDFANSRRPRNNPVQVVIPTLSPPSMHRHVHTSMHAYTYTPVAGEGVEEALRQLCCPPPVRMHPRLESGHVEQNFRFPFSGISESLTGPSKYTGGFSYSSSHGLLRVVVLLSSFTGELTEARMVQGLPSIALTAAATEHREEQYSYHSDFSKLHSSEIEEGAPGVRGTAPSASAPSQFPPPLASSCVTPRCDRQSRFFQAPQTATRVHQSMAAVVQTR